MNSLPRRAATILALAVAVAACSVQDSVRDGPFALVITTPRTEWAQTDEIQVQATLLYHGGPPVRIVFGYGSGLIGFSVDEVSGTRRMDAAWLDSCRRYSIERARPLTMPYRKSGGFDDTDAAAAFYRQFFADPLFLLPPGRWRITAVSQFSTAGCGTNDVDLQASLLITVR